jgi:hypothetical protein
MARVIYKTADGKRVPSVTTIIKSISFGGEGLMYWAWKAGDEGLTLEEARAPAVTVGTVAHALIEAHIKGEEADLVGLPAPIVARALVAFNVWKEWAELTGYKMVESETSLVDDEYRFGGTFDCVMVEKKRVLVDWKTSGGLYPEHLVQIAAYGHLWNKHHPNEPIEGYALLRLGRDEALFDYHFRPPDGVMLAAWEMFLLARRAYDLAKEVRKAA